METYPTDQLYEEVAFIAYHFNWSREEIMELPHEERKRWCDEISAINQRINKTDESASPTSSDDGVTISQAIDFGEEE